MLIPGRPAPPLSLPTLSQESWSLAGPAPERFWLLVFYRGFHCAICCDYLRELDELYGEFVELGVSPIAISMDSAEKAHESRETWKLEALPVAYGLDMERAKAWGLFLSKGVLEDEPAQFSEPALFLVRSNGFLYGSSVSSMPFARANFRELLAALEQVIKYDYPARAELSRE